MRRFVSTSRPLVMATAFTFSAIFMLPAHAFADDEARRAILELRQQVRQMHDQNQQARFLLADQIETLQHEIADMRGQIERMRFELDINKRAGQDQAGGSSIQVDNPREQASYDNAMGLFRSGKYKEAAQGLNGFLQDYPNSQLASEAKFYLGSSMYATKDFKGSVAQLQKLSQDAPNDPRAPDALLIVAASKIELNDMAGAKASLEQIVRDYPQSSAADTAKSRLELLQ
ncbi:tol-pal system protein YbgF [Pusillimonas sp.]|uniref:tol-pal system protein YbgF n=1 Tax=Pusillimonas sp. TaxID=3040095 RepID=UPI0037C988DF